MITNNPESDNGGGGGSIKVRPSVNIKQDPFQKWVITIFSSLSIAAIIGLVSFTVSVTVFRARVESTIERTDENLIKTTQEYERHIKFLEARLDSMEKVVAQNQTLIGTKYDSLDIRMDQMMSSINTTQRDLATLQTQVEFMREKERINGNPN